MNIKSICAAAVLSVSAAMAQAGTVVAFGDEWTTSDRAYAENEDTPKLIENLVGLLGGTDYLVTGSPYNPYLYGTKFTDQLRQLGKTVTVFESNSAFLTEYKKNQVLFLGGQLASDYRQADSRYSDLINEFIADGGSVVVSLGTGVVGAAQEASLWNKVLNPNGLSAVGRWGPNPGIINLAVGDNPNSALDDGLENVTWGYGNYIMSTPDSENTQLIGAGVFGPVAQAPIAIAGEQPAEPVDGQVPLPAGLPLMLAGLGGLALMRRR